MKILNAFYFSGTGNTRYVTETLCKKLSVKYNCASYDITGSEDFTEKLSSADVILLAFPIYGSDAPIPMRAFIHKYSATFAGKAVIIAETQYFFSGDGAASIGRTVKKFGGDIIAAEHFNMPNNLADCKIFAIRNGKELENTLLKANKKIDIFAERIIKGKKKLRGFDVFSHAVGFYCQRKFWRKNEYKKRSLLKINRDACIGCGACVKQCPVENLKIQQGKAVSADKCVMCYRCVNLCPKRAITLIGSSAPEKQYKGPKIQ